MKCFSEGQGWGYLHHPSLHPAANTKFNASALQPKIQKE